jgi:hypothetical protein
MGSGSFVARLLTEGEVRAVSKPQTVLSRALFLRIVPLFELCLDAATFAAVLCVVDMLSRHSGVAAAHPFRQMLVVSAFAGVLVALLQWRRCADPWTWLHPIYETATVLRVCACLLALLLAASFLTGISALAPSLWASLCSLLCLPCRRDFVSPA